MPSAGPRGSPRSAGRLAEELMDILASDPPVRRGTSSPVGPAPVQVTQRARLDARTGRTRRRGSRRSADHGRSSLRALAPKRGHAGILAARRYQAEPAWSSEQLACVATSRSRRFLSRHWPGGVPRGPPSRRRRRPGGPGSRGRRRSARRVPGDAPTTGPGHCGQAATRPWSPTTRHRRLSPAACAHSKTSRAGSRTQGGRPRRQRAQTRQTRPRTPARIKEPPPRPSMATWARP